MTKPITPKEAQKEAGLGIPDVVYDAFNYFIKKNYKKEGFTVKQQDVIDHILETSTLSRRDIFENKYLDIESAYEKVGWKVGYDKPGYNENGSCYFEFTPPVTRS